MANRKSPVFLRVVIIIVALLLGLSLNMFQFRDPFRNIANEQPPNLSEAEKTARDKAARGGQESNPPAVSGAKNQDAALPPASALQGSGQSSDTMTLPEHAPIVIPDKHATAPAVPAAPASTAPEGKEAAPEPERADVPKADASASEKDHAEASEGKHASSPAGPETSGLALPKVTSDAAVAKAGGIGRKMLAQAGPNNDGTAAKAKDSEPSPDQAGGLEQTGKAGMSPPPPPVPALSPEMPQSAASASVPAAAGEQKASPTERTATDVGKPSATASPASSAATPGSTVEPEKAGQSSSPAELPARTGQVAPATPQPASAPAASEGNTPTQTPQTIEAAEAKTPAPKGGKVLSIKTQDLAGEFMITIETDGPVERVTSFHAKSPARLVVDMWGAWQPGGPLTLPVQSGIMEKIRQGAHPEKLRLVLDYRDKDLVEFSEPSIEKQPKAVVVKVPKAR